MDFGSMMNDVINGVTGVANTLTGDMTLLAMAGIVIVLAALFMSSLEQLISTTMTALFAYVVLQVVWAAYNSEWDFAGPVNGVWDSFAGEAGLTFFAFMMYFIVFAVGIAIVNIIKGMVAG